MECKNCGEHNAEDARYCAKCGAPLSTAVAPSPAAAPSSAVAQPSVQAVVYEKTSGMAITALVLGIISIFLNPLAILAIIFGAVGIAQTSRPEVKGRGMAVAGLVIGIVVAAVWIILIVLFSAAFSFFLI